MQVKWSKSDTGRLAASLTDGRRVNGEPRNRHIGMLATLRPAAPGHPTAAERAAFWEQAQASLDRLQDRLGPGERAVVVAKLHARVPMPDGENTVI